MASNTCNQGITAAIWYADQRTNTLWPEQKRTIAPSMWILGKVMHMAAQPFMVSQALEERRWHEQLLTMRHLPPGTKLPQPRDPEERELLNTLLALPDDAAPLRWLMAERGSVVALLALRRLLRGLGTRAIALRENTARGWARADEGGFVRLLIQVEPLILLTHDPAPGADQLREALSALRHLALSPPATADWHLLNEILHLSSDTDPLHWLEEERGEVAARDVLRMALQSARPPTTMSIGDQLVRHRPRQGVPLSGGLRVGIDELTLGQAGFSLTTRIRFAWKQSLPDGGRRLPSWVGFDRVVDDRGHHYLLQVADRQAGTHLWWYLECLRMACYPAVSADATVLTFSALPATLTSLHTRPSMPPKPLPDEPLKNVVWRVTLPARA